MSVLLLFYKNFNAKIRNKRLYLSLKMAFFVFTSQINGIQQLFNVIQLLFDWWSVVIRLVFDSWSVVGQWLNYGEPE